MLNPAHPVPLYRQLADELERAIDGGSLKPGDRIASEHELATTHGIGRPTVRQATDHLVRLGLLERRRGSGTFVLAPRHPVDLFTLGGTVAAFEGAGIELSMRISESVRCLSPSDGSGCDSPLATRRRFAYARIGKADQRPVLSEHLELDADVFRAFDRLPIDREPLSALVQKHYHRRPSAGRQTIRAWSLSGEQAASLEAPLGHRALLIERTLDFAGAPCAIFARMVVLTERVVLTQTLSEPHLSSTICTRQESA